MVDFSGSGVVHLVGGTCALIGAACLGARKGRFVRNGDVTDDDLKGHSVPVSWCFRGFTYRGTHFLNMKIISGRLSSSYPPFMISMPVAALYNASLSSTPVPPKPVSGGRSVRDARQ
jgi:hypothetical protein